jgi:hypothetical protein
MSCSSLTLRFGTHEEVVTGDELARLERDNDVLQRSRPH